MNPAPVLPCCSAFCLVYEKFKLRTLFWIQGLWHWVRFVSTNYETFAPKKFLFTYLLSLCWGENGHLCWLLEERWKACSMCDDAEENRSDKKNKFTVLSKGIRILHALSAFHALHVRFQFRRCCSQSLLMSEGK